MASSLRDFFPFGDAGPDTLAAAKARFPDLPAESLLAAFALGRAVIDMLEALPAPLIQHGLSPARWRLLVALMFQSDDGTSSIGSLAQHLQIAEPTVTATVKRMEEEDLVQRTRNTTDGRRVDVAITPAGITTVAKVFPSVVPHITRFVGALGGPEATDAIAKQLSQATNAIKP